VAKEAGLIKGTRKVLQLFGTLGGAALGAPIGTAAGGTAAGATAGAALGGAAGEGLKYILDIGSKLGAEWKPMVFGQWYKARIAKLLDEQSK
jgi:hypothetical protein